MLLFLLMFSTKIFRNAKNLLRSTHVYSHYINVRLGLIMSSIGVHATIFFLSGLKESITENGADQINTYYDVINISKTKNPQNETVTAKQNTSKWGLWSKEINKLFALRWQPTPQYLHSLFLINAFHFHHCSHEDVDRNEQAENNTEPRGIGRETQCDLLYMIFLKWNLSPDKLQMWCDALQCQTEHALLWGRAWWTLRRTSGNEPLCSS